MSETEPTADELAEQKRKEDLEKSNAGLKEKSTDELIDIIHSTRSEAKDYRLTLKGIKEEIEVLKGDKAKEEQDKLIADGKKDEVIAGLNGKVIELTKKATEWDNYNTTKREALKTNLKDNWLESFATMPLSDLEVLAGKFNGAKDAIDTDTGTPSKVGSAKVEALKKDLVTAIERKDLPAQFAIKRQMTEEGQK